MTGKRKKWLYRMIVAVLVMAIFGACSSRKNTASSRFFNALNSRYNIYYNGKMSFDEALKAQNDGYKENYTEQIVMFPVSNIYKQEKTTDGGPFNRAIQKGEKAIKLHSIREKPPRKPGWQNDPVQVRLQQQEEYNPFLKNCWLLMAESQYYNGDFLTAAVTFSYIARHYATDPEVVAKARIWQARCYSEMAWDYEVNNALNRLKESGIPRKQQRDYNKMYANYMIRTQKLEEAIPYLQSSIKSEKNKRQRSRIRYLLGQIYQTLDKKDLAYETYNKLAKSNPPYEIEFSARIRQTEVFPGGNYQKVIRMLKSMAKSDKNQDFLDQVYYAMGNVYMTRQDTVQAIECYREGIEKSTQNGMDKAICQIRLGDIYFTQKDYINAQPCFSGAMAGIQKEYKDYQRVAKLSETLDELVVHYENVHLQDSLQTLAKMPEKERLAVIDKIIEQVIEEEKRAAEEAEKEEYLANQASMGSNMNRTQQINMPSMPMGGGGDNSFYFYNQQTVVQGKTQFQNKWGKRTLEDNWRRRNKRMTLMQTEENQDNNMTGSDIPDISENPSDTSAVATEDTLSSDPKTHEYYLQQIPMTEEDIEASNIIIADGLYNMGMVYKDRLEDKNLSVETFEELDKRFPDNSYRLDYYFQIYLMGLRYKDAELAEKYKNKLMTEFPDSEYATAVADPNYEYNMRMMDVVQDSIYEETYHRYLAEDTAAVRHNYLNFSQKYPLSVLMPKFMFLDALTYVQAGDPEGFKAALEVLTEKYPTADVSELAKEMLKGLLSGRQLMQGSFSTMTWNLRFGANPDGSLSAEDSARIFSDNKDIAHRLLLVYTRGALDRNQLLYAVAAYNFANFRVKGFDLGFEDVGNISMMTVSGFNNFTEVMDYYRMIYGENGYASAMDEFVTFFPISDENYDILMHGKTFEEYMSFFLKNHGEQYPELANRWKIRVETDLEEEILQNPEENISEEEQTPEQETVIPQNETVRQQETIPDDIEEVINQRIDSLKSRETEIESEERALATDSIANAEEEERPKAKGENIFQRLFKKVKESKEYQSIEQGINTAKQLAQEDSIPTDTVAENQPLQRVDGELTFDQLQEIRKQEAAAQAVLDSISNATTDSVKVTTAETKKQQAAEREKLRKEKEKAAKERLREKEKAAKEKLRQQKKAQQERERARQKALREKEAAAKAKKKGK
ncbi:MAG: tetratricopeptide repeat protein [Tannerella sp.]|jgi:tetratricopeptide (TPR) repeat protein|nr:tetratricopeptide repeat protein [Tannerella sp.]